MKRLLFLLIALGHAHTMQADQAEKLYQDLLNRLVDACNKRDLGRQRHLAGMLTQIPQENGTFESIRVLMQVKDRIEHAKQSASTPRSARRSSTPKQQIFDFGQKNKFKAHA